MNTHKGLRLDVYRSADGIDCTAHGITSTHPRLTLIGTLAADGTFTPSPHSARVFAPTPDAPAVALRERMGTTHLVPVTTDGEPLGGHWYMAGGNYATTTDSRQGDYYEQLGLDPIYGATSVHDRTEVARPGSLTPYDTGERAEPKLWQRNRTEVLHTMEIGDPENIGNVDFDGDEGNTVATVHVSRDPDLGYTVHVIPHIDEIRLDLHTEQ